MELVQTGHSRSSWTLVVLEWTAGDTILLLLPLLLWDFNKEDNWLWWRISSSSSITSEDVIQSMLSNSIQKEIQKKPLSKLTGYFPMGIIPFWKDKNFDCTLIDAKKKRMKTRLKPGSENELHQTVPG